MAFYHLADFLQFLHNKRTSNIHGISPSLLSNCLLILSITLTVLILRSDWKRRAARPATVSLPPGPKPWPIVGSLVELVRNKPAFRWIHKMMEKMNTEIMCLRLGNTHLIIVSSPEIAVEFLKNQDDVFADRPRILSAEITSRGYLATFSAPLGEQWEKMRRIFTSEVLSTPGHRWFLAKRTEEADHIVRFVYNQTMDQTTAGVVNVRVIAQHFCGNVIRKMIFGKRFFGSGRADGGPGVEEEEHVSSLFTVDQYHYFFCVSDYLPWLRGRVDLDGHEKVIRRALARVAKYHEPEIDERIRQWREGIRTKQDDLLDLYIGLKGKDGGPLLSPEEIKAEIVDFCLASVDNTSNAIEWTLAELINQPMMLKRATDEIDRVVRNQRLVQESDISQLNYIKSCLKESFRLHPVTAFNIPHVSTTDTKVAGYFIPKGSHVLLSRPGLGRNSRVWDDPLRFIPERHMQEDGSNVVLTEQNLKILSFSIGKRGCPAVNLGSAMTIMLMARLLQGFSWELPPTVSKINLSESAGSLFLAEPLHAKARPRLAETVYDQLLSE